MNHRCYQCGWSFTLGREAVEAAVAQAGQEKTFALPCPRCRRINKIPVLQLRRTLPPGWTPPPVETGPAITPTPVSEPAPPAAALTVQVDTPGEDEAPKPAARKRAATSRKAAVDEAVAKEGPAAKTTGRKSSGREPKPG